MSGLQWWQGLGGAAGILSAMNGKNDGFTDPTTTDFTIPTLPTDLLTKAKKAADVGKIGVIVALVVIVVINILFVVLAYKMFPENKALHAILTLILGLFWFVPAAMYYLFFLKGYYMRGIRITKH